MRPKNVTYLDKFSERKVQAELRRLGEDLPDSLAAWMDSYLRLAVAGVRSEAVAQKIALHLSCFQAYFLDAYGHDRVSACLRRDVLSWQTHLRAQELAPAAMNNHLASLSAFTTWVQTQRPDLFAVGDPAKGVGDLGLPPLEPRALSPDQVRSHKNLCDRLEHFHQHKGRRRKPDAGGKAIQAHGRPWRDRAIVSVLLSTGLRREELVRLDWNQVEPASADELRSARRARITRVHGKGKTERTDFFSRRTRVRHSPAIWRRSDRKSPHLRHRRCFWALRVSQRVGPMAGSPRRQSTWCSPKSAAGTTRNNATRRRASLRCGPMICATRSPFTWHR